MSELCMNCFSVKGAYEVCPYCGYVEGTPPKQPHYLTREPSWGIGLLWGLRLVWEDSELPINVLT